MYNTVNCYTLDSAFVKSERIVVPVTQVMKVTLEKVAYDHRLSVAELARACIFQSAESMYPNEFSQIYNENAQAILRENKYGK